MDAESYQSFRISGDAITESRTIAPEADGAQHHLVLLRAAAIEHKSTMHVAIGADDETHPHVEIVVLNEQERIRS